MLFAAIWMDLEIIILSEVRERQIYDIAYMWNLKRGTNELIYKTEIESQMQKTNYGYPGVGGRRGGINWEIGTDIYTIGN